jgi:hypothetical protein
MSMRVSPWLRLQQHPGIGSGSGTFGIFVVAISLLMIPSGTDRASILEGLWLLGLLVMCLGVATGRIQLPSPHHRRCAKRTRYGDMLRVGHTEREPVKTQHNLLYSLSLCTTRRRRLDRPDGDYWILRCRVFCGAGISFVKRNTCHQVENTYPGRLLSKYSVKQHGIKSKWPSAERF